MIAAPVKTYTPEEYLEFETTSTTRNEYRHGEIIPMTGGTPIRQRIMTVAKNLAITAQFLAFRNIC
nr:hypothetical protein [Pseudanabaena biceps]